MEHSIGTGLIVGIVTASSLYVWNSESFTKPQKTALLICVIFPPAQWVGIIIMLLYNNYIESNSVEKLTERKVEQNTNTLNSQIIQVSFTTDKGKIEIELSNPHNTPEPGKKAFKNGKIAPDGKYKFGFMWFVHIKEGIVTEISLF